MILRERKPTDLKLRQNASLGLAPATMLLGLVIAGFLQTRPIFASAMMVAIGLVIVAIGGYAKRVAP